jgi:hypothetical protein
MWYPWVVQLLLGIESLLAGSSDVTLIKRLELAIDGQVDTQQAFEAISNKVGQAAEEEWEKEEKAVLEDGPTSFKKIYGVAEKTGVPAYKQNISIH